jgi:hypothetical protein
VLTKTCHTLRRRVLLAIPAAAVAASLVGSPLASATPMPANPGAPQPTVGSAPTSTAQGIIMRDGGVCDPIRHMGC